jgi:hypothetical protein
VESLYRNSIYRPMSAPLRFCNPADRLNIGLRHEAAVPRVRTAAAIE